MCILHTSAPRKREGAKNARPTQGDTRRGEHHQSWTKHKVRHNSPLQLRHRGKGQTLRHHDSPLRAPARTIPQHGLPCRNLPRLRDNKDRDPHRSTRKRTTQHARPHRHADIRICLRRCRRNPQTEEHTRSRAQERGMRKTLQRDRDAACPRTCPHGAQRSTHKHRLAARDLHPLHQPHARD